MPFGLGFADALTGKTDQQNGMNGSQTPIQDAIKVLSLRIPSFVGARGMSPLLGGMGSMGMGMPGDGGPGGLEELLRRLFGQPGMSPGGSAPAPGVMPGGEDRMPMMPEPPPMPNPGMGMPQPKPGGGGPSPSLPTPRPPRIQSY